MKIEILYHSPKDLIRAGTKPTVPRYSRVNGRDVECLSVTRLGDGDVVVSWIDPRLKRRFVMRYFCKPGVPLTLRRYNKRKTKITINLNGRNEIEVFENVRN